jgi:TnsA-like endonuclease N terminal/TnsA endonuclease C terminal
MYQARDDSRTDDCYKEVSIDMPVRKIPKSYCSVTGLVASSKNNRMSAFESTLERDLMLLLEFDFNVLEYEEQPVKIEYEDNNGKLHSYIPDLLITYRRDIAPAKWKKHVLAEVKYRQNLFADWKILKPKFKAARAYAKSKGWDFRIFTDKEIRTHYLTNAKFLLPYRSLPLDQRMIEIILSALDRVVETDPESLLLACSMDLMEQAQFIPMIWRLICAGMIGIDLDLPLNMRSRIWSVR